MLGLLGDAQGGGFKLVPSVKRENVAFLFVSKLAVAFCLVMVLVLGLSEYFGDRINCINTNNQAGAPSGDEVNDFCLIHGTRYVNKGDASAMKEALGLLDGDINPYCDILNLPNTEDEEDNREKKQADQKPDTVYYQWVPFIFLLNAVVFTTPYFFWRWSEGGFIKGFLVEGNQAKNVCQSIDDPERRDLAKSQARYFRMKMKSHKCVIWTLIACEAANLLVVSINFGLVNLFLGGTFEAYGVHSIKFLDGVLKQDDALSNPMCYAFPTMTQCNYIKTLSSSTDNTVYSYLCILPHNIANQKIFLAFWFLFIILFIVATVGIIYRIVTLSLHRCRKNQILDNVDFGHWDQDAKKKIERMVDNHFSEMEQFGDWYMLQLIGKNVDTHYFNYFVVELSNALEDGWKYKSGLAELDEVTTDDEKKKLMHEEA